MPYLVGNFWIFHFRRALAKPAFCHQLSCSSLERWVFFVEKVLGKTIVQQQDPLLLEAASPAFQCLPTRRPKSPQSLQTRWIMWRERRTGYPWQCSPPKKALSSLLFKTMMLQTYLKMFGRAWHYFRSGLRQITFCSCPVVRLFFSAEE